MNLTDLNQSKLLKEWGAPQDIDFYWCETVEGSTEDYYLVWTEDSVVEHPEPGDIAAYGLESLIGWLPHLIHGGVIGGFEMCLRNCGAAGFEASYQKWELPGFNNHRFLHKFYGKTPLEAVFNLAKAIHAKH